MHRQIHKTEYLNLSYMSHVTIEKSTLQNTENQVEVSAVVQTIIVNNNMADESVADNE